MTHVSVTTVAQMPNTTNVQGPTQKEKYLVACQKASQLAWERGFKTLFLGVVTILLPILFSGRVDRLPEMPLVEGLVGGFGGLFTLIGFTRWILAATNSTLKELDKKQSHHGKTKLMDACESGDESRVEELLALGADVNVISNGGYTALSYAAKKGNVTIIQLLLTCGASTKIKDELRPPLQEAILNNEDAALALLNAGADWTQCFEGRKAIHLASMKGHNRVIEKLLTAREPVDVRTIGNQDTPLILAAFSGYSGTVTMLLDKGADRNAQDQSGRTALFWAAQKGRAQSVQVLVNAGAEIRGDEVWTAINNGHTGIAKTLLAKNPALARATFDGGTLLQFAARRGDDEVAEALVNAGANLDAVDSSGSTALHYLSHSQPGKSDIRIAKMLIERGAKRDIRNNAGQTAAETASGQSYKDLHHALTYTPSPDQRA